MATPINKDLTGSKMSGTNNIIHIDEPVIPLNALLPILPDPESSTQITNLSQAPSTHPDILVFLTGANDLREACHLLRTRCKTLNIPNILPISLLSSSSQHDSDLATGSMPHHIARRVIFATNVAETSLTFATLGHVVDCGWEKVANFDNATQITELNLQPISHASAIQRSGRAGRTGRGVCHRLYTRAEFDGMEPFKGCEADLGLTALKVIHYGYDLHTFDWLRMPDEDRLENTLELVEDLGMVRRKVDRLFGGAEYELTRDGEVAVKMNLDPKEARALITAHRLGISADYLVLIAMRRLQDAFVGVDRDADRHHLADESGASITQLQIYNEWASEASTAQWQKVYNVSESTLKMVKRDVHQLTKQFGACLGQRRDSRSMPGMTTGRLAELISRADLSGYYMHLAKANDPLLGPRNGFALLADRKQAEVDRHDPLMVTSVLDLKIDWVVFVHARRAGRTFLHLVDRVKEDWILSDAPESWLLRVGYVPGMDLCFKGNLEGMGREVNWAIQDEVRKLRRGDKEWRCFAGQRRVDIYGPNEEKVLEIVGGLSGIAAGIEQKMVDETMKYEWGNGRSVTLKGAGEVAEYIVQNEVGAATTSIIQQDPVQLRRVVLMNVHADRTPLDVEFLLTLQYGPLLTTPQSSSATKIEPTLQIPVRTFFAEFLNSDHAFQCVTTLWRPKDPTFWNHDLPWIASASYNIDIEIPKSIPFDKCFRRLFDNQMRIHHGQDPIPPEMQLSAKSAWYIVVRSWGPTYSIRPTFNKVRNEALQLIYRAWFFENGLFAHLEIPVTDHGVAIALQNDHYLSKWNALREEVHVSIESTQPMPPHANHIRFAPVASTATTCTISIRGDPKSRLEVQAQIEEDLNAIKSDIVMEELSFKRRDFHKWRNWKVGGRSFADFEREVGVSIEVIPRQQVVTFQGRRRDVEYVRGLVMNDIKMLREQEMKVAIANDGGTIEEPIVENPCAMCDNSCERKEQPALCGNHFVHKRCLWFHVVETARRAAREGRRVELVCPGDGCQRKVVKRDWEIEMGEGDDGEVLRGCAEHYGEEPGAQWGPEQDINSTRVLKTLLDIEKPDLVVFTGDQITADFMGSNATAYYEMLLQPLIEGGYKWASVYGNHDNGRTVSREELMHLEQNYPLSYSQYGPKTLKGVTNYHLPLYAHLPQGMRPDKEHPHLIMHFVDSHGNASEPHGKDMDWVTKEQTTHLLSTHRHILKTHNLPSIPSLVFVHIPPPQLQKLNANLPEHCTGLHDEEEIGTQKRDEGFLDGVVRLSIPPEVGRKPPMAGDMERVGMFMGHCHGTGWCCRYTIKYGGNRGVATGVDACLGRHTGYGGYGNWVRGGRVIKIKEGKEREWKTWVRLEDGSVESGWKQ
ncbi:hypothetical protein HDV00_001148 [Rhizophlyctis rosea]|nr:hypothetical protein HDV00_001148 [Rhizophlyctis rosea]